LFGGIKFHAPTNFLIKKKMDKNEIKKFLYKQNPKAELLYIRAGFAYYDAVIRTSETPVIIHKTVFFQVPISDMGTTDFLPLMEAKHLIRWINLEFTGV
jgi:hypothetical protein